MEWLERSDLRMAVMKVLSRPKMTSEIHEQALNNVVSLSNTSEVLKALMEEDLLICINPKEKIGRLYGLTTKGIMTRKRIYPDEQPYQDILNQIIKDYSYLLRGKHRRAVIKVMDNKKNAQSNTQGCHKV